MTEEQALLGLATTRELLTELNVRGEMVKYDSRRSATERAHAQVIVARTAELLRETATGLLDYRTVDSE